MTKETIYGRADADPNLQLPKRGDHAVYEYVDSGTVREKDRRKARQLVDRVSRELRLGHVRIRYFRHIATFPAELVPDGRLGMLHPVGHDPSDYVFANIAESDAELTAGHVRPDRLDEIAILASLRGALLAHAVIHECRHLRQFRDGATGDLERDANRYALRVA